MPQIIQAIHYYRFIKWFKRNHLQLYAKYKWHISPSRQSYQIAADLETVSPNDRPLVAAAIRQYYSSVAD